MRNRLVTLLILLMVTFPVWSASTVCCHVQKTQQHHCCHHAMSHADTAQGAAHCQHPAAGTCHCDQFQHSQFVLSLPEMPLVQSVAHFMPEMSVPTALADRHESIIRPPIV
ncbi:MAG: hypothetical protein PHE17_20805 [Thiothrix sp.]|uniref:hypothetical protein n=1 Tax=Thiothrix sp. TaxID=1032 RepID=UPI0026047595|nr:hypothetical protein [Thiothrix sp.]MDD5395472.1 hypothetical protein [Thiothrix sp.]